MKPADRAQALKTAQLLEESADDYGCRNLDGLCNPATCRGTLLRASSDTIRALLRHIGALTPMARAWATGEPRSNGAASVRAAYVMDPAEDC